jgi:23S rRNA (guanosine2251-2'-O)-methyltransferase
VNRFDKPHRFGRGQGRERADIVSPYSEAPRLVIGMQPVREAIRVHSSRLGAVLVEQSTGDAAGRLDALARFGESQGARVERMTRKDLDALAGNAPHQGAATWAPALVLHEPEDILARPDLLAVALDGIQDPQNFGAVVRSSVALGGTAVVWPENASAPLTPATFRASAGAIEHASLCRVSSLVRFLDAATNAGAQAVGLAAEGQHALHELDLTGPTVLVIGSEHDGLGRAIRSRCSSLARLTLRGPIDSLNASAACAAALYVTLVQRDMKSKIK